MAIGRRIRDALYALLLTFGILLWLVALLLFSQVAENSDDFARYRFWILLINSVGIAVLSMLIVTNLTRLIRDYRRHVPGARLKARMVSLLVVLAITPLVIVYIFSVEFITRGIDEWFNVDVERGLQNALELSRSSLDLQKRDNLAELRDMAQRALNAERLSIIGELDSIRRSSRAEELTIFGVNNQIVVTSSGDPAAAVPAQLSDEILFQLRQGNAYVSLQPRAGDRYDVVTAVILNDQVPTGEQEILRGIFPVEQRLNELANSVQASFNQFTELAFLRTALKYSFTLTLSLVLLISILASVYGAFFSARRLIVPIQQLMQGTRAVARGDLDTRLPVPAHDEIGFLVNSFNEMTQRLASARQEARSSEQQVESERRKLEVILARLSTGVVSLEADLRIRTANEAAGAILGFDLEEHVSESLVELAASRPQLAQFLEVASAHLDAGTMDWREQIVLRGDTGRRVLMCACSELPSDGERAGGYVLVFDDITALLQAQRDAAWGEVARRLAHEIKNPLTPIQLSAERLRRRYLTPDGEDLDLLDRATHTIIQQVEAMKEMVNAFSQYARAPDVELSRFDINDLIGEVTELYRHQQESPVAIKLSVDSNLPPIVADIGRMRQVLHNLMRNSIESMENQRDARVDIATRQVSVGNSDMIEISVSDNGPGFSDELKHQAFEPYVTSKPKGTGLGLAIVKKLVEEHGGQIRAGNRERGGAEIVILIPVSGGMSEPQSGAPQDNRRERA
jgi:PAS domain S-box-containing protein